MAERLPHQLRHHPPRLWERIHRRSEQQPSPEKDNPLILLPPWLQAKLPSYRESMSEGDPIAHVRYMVPGSDWEWYVGGWKEHHGTHYFYGWVNGNRPEFGTFTLSFVQEFAAILDVQAERDIFFTPRPISVIRKELGK